MLRRIATLLTVLALGTATLGLSACNTMTGAGKDLSAAGHDLSGGSTATQNKIVDKTGAAKD